MTLDNKREIRFYVCLGLAYILMVVSLILPPLNVITQSVLYASVLILGVGALAVGIDIKGIIHEVRLIKLQDLEIFNKKSE